MRSYFAVHAGACWELCLDKHGDDLVAIDFGGRDRSPVPFPHFRSRMHSWTKEARKDMYTTS